MDLRHFRYFIAVAETLHFSQAADLLGIAAPTLTVQIQEMERQLRVQLLSRTKRRVTLTAAGQAFLVRARHAVDQFEQTVDLGRRLGQGSAGSMTIGYIGSAVFSGVLQEHVGVFRRSWPDVAVQIKEYPMWQLPGLMYAHDIDVAFVRLPLVLEDSLEVHVLICDTYCLAVRPDHPFAKTGKPVEPASLASERFIAPEQVEGTSEIGRRGDFAPHIVSSPGSLLSVLTQVSLGAGVAVVPDILATAIRLPDVVYLPIADHVIVSESAVVFRRDETSPAVKNFINQMRQIPTVMCAGAE
jgi:DNA-binding transcriptional LysR family regulator